MRLNRTDIFATCAVGVGVLAYVLWLAEVAVPGLGSARIVGAVVLGLGWLASAVAVVPNVNALIHSSPAYLVVTSALGVTALTAGVIVLATAHSAMLALLVSTTVVMWVLATIRHARAARSRGESTPVVAAEEPQQRVLVSSGR